MKRIISISMLFLLVFNVSISTVNADINPTSDRPPISLENLKD